MATSDADMIAEVENFGQYTDEELDTEDLQTALSRAKRHLKNEADLGSNPEWYDDTDIEEALFWTSMLFSKVVNGELDAKAFTAGNIDSGELLSYSGGEITLWFREYRRTKNRLVERNTNRNVSVGRTSQDGNRNYSYDEEL